MDGRKYRDEDFDEALRDALRDRAARDVIRKVHLKSNDTGLLTAIISSLIPESEDVRPSSIESIMLKNVDVSDLFARHLAKSPSLGPFQDLVLGLSEIVHHGAYQPIAHISHHCPILGHSNHATNIFTPCLES